MKLVIFTPILILCSFFALFVMGVNQLTDIESSAMVGLVTLNYALFYLWCLQSDVRKLRGY